MASIELRNLAKSFGGGIAAISPLELSIPAGELLVVLGPSGSGKTTLLRLIAGLEVPSAGSVLIGGENVSTLPPHHRDVAMVFQHPALYPHLSVFDNMAFGLRAGGVPRRELVPRVKTMAGILELEGLLRRKPAELSGGQRQRVAIGRALVRQPRVILLDEPFSNLDLPLRTSLRAQVVDLQHRFGTTLIHVTHDQAEALAIGQRLAVFDQGRMLQVGSPRAIYERPANRFVASFVGSPPINILPCRIEPEAGGAHVYPSAADGSLKWTLGRGSLPAGWDGTPRLLDLGVRPEDLSVFDPEGSLAVKPTFLTLPAQVRNVEFNGPELIATLLAAQQQLVARLTPRQELRQRKYVTVAIDSSRLLWFDPATGAGLQVSPGNGA